MFTERAAGVPPHLEQVFQSLEDLLPVAKKNNLVLGVENRYYFREIPSLEEIHQIFKRFSSSSLFYWHDVGHAQVSENLGFSLHADFLQSFSPRMAGIHLHDVKGIKDHLAPGDGDFNFAQLTPYLKNNPLMVLEAHSPATAQQITLAKLYLEKLFAQQLKNKD
jgi:sugar phosphate isomerase/epimerase